MLKVAHMHMMHVKKRMVEKCENCSQLASFDDASQTHTFGTGSKALSSIYGHIPTKILNKEITSSN